MKKICPYCGRVDELGTSCKGCGYILRQTDKNAPDKVPTKHTSSHPANKPNRYISKDASKQKKSDVKNDVSSSVKPEKPEPVKSIKFTQPIKKDRTKEDRVSNHTRTTGRGSATKPWQIILGLCVIIYGVIGFIKILHFYPDGDILNGIVGSAFSITMIMCGLSCFQLFRRYLGRYARFVIILGLVITIGIPLSLLISPL